MQNAKSIFTALLLVVLLTTKGLFAQFAGGSGTESDPFKIATPEHLNEVRNYLGDAYAGKYFKMMNDIDLTVYLAPGGAGYAAWGDAGWLPIGYPGIYFCGRFNGENHKISGIKIDRPENGCIALFGFIGLDAILENIGVEISDVSFVKGYDSVGGLVGNSFGSINNCYTKGEVIGHYCVGGLSGISMGNISNCFSNSDASGTQYIGGLVGESFCGSISNCYATGSVNGSSIHIGGLVGWNDSESNISNCYATGNVTGKVIGIGVVGGLVGYNDHEASISNCFSTGSVYGHGRVGGLVGVNYNIITNCYFTGSVYGDSSAFVGGLVGVNYNMITNCYSTGSVYGDNSSFVGGLVGFNRIIITNCYSTGFTSGTHEVGGLVGYNDYNGVTTNSYWDVETSEQTTSASGTGKTTAEMKMQSTYDGWDFFTTWSINSGINSGYPYLTNTPVGIETGLTQKSVTLLSNYPNPFNPTTTINYELQKLGFANLSVYNAKGELVKTLINGMQTAGRYCVNFDGAGLNSGVYFYKLQADGKSLVNKMVLCK